MSENAPYCIMCGNKDLDDDSYCKFCDMFANLIWEDLDADASTGSETGNATQPKRDTDVDIDF